MAKSTNRLRENPDGSLTIHIQNKKPDGVSNWLPAPAGPVTMTKRFYGAKTSVLDGSYRLPAVQRAK